VDIRSKVSSWAALLPYILQLANNKQLLESPSCVLAFQMHVSVLVIGTKTEGALESRHSQEEPARGNSSTRRSRVSVCRCPSSSERLMCPAPNSSSSPRLSISAPLRLHYLNTYSRPDQIFTYHPSPPAASSTFPSELRRCSKSCGKSRGQCSICWIIQPTD